MEGISGDGRQKGVTTGRVYVVGRSRSRNGIVWTARWSKTRALSAQVTQRTCLCVRGGGQPTRHQPSTSEAERASHSSAWHSGEFMQGEACTAAKVCPILRLQSACSEREVEGG